MRSVNCSKSALRVVVVALLIAAGSVIEATRMDRRQAASSGGSAYPESFFSALKWRSIGPNRGGRSIAVAGSPSRPLEYYFGATGGGLWKTTDGGTTWKPVSDKAFTSSSVGAVAVSETNPDIVYVGMGETELRGNVIQGDGVYKTTDGGKTWTNVGLRDTQAIAKVRIDRTNPDLVYVAALGHPYAPHAERGVFRSKDGGKTWEKILFRNDQTGAIDLAIDPNDARVLYASLWEVYRRPWQLSSGGPGCGFFKSTNGGDTWTEITRSPGLPTGLIGKIGIAVSGADSKRVYAIVESEEGGVFRSDDAGGTWTKVNDERKLRQRAFYYSRIYADPKERDVVYVLNTDFFKSTDGGKTFPTLLKVPHGDNHDLWIAPNDSKRMVNANDGGGTVSWNGGETWTDLDFPTAQFYNVFTTKHQPYHVCGAQQDNSTACVPSDGNGSYLYPVGGGESGYIAPHPQNTDIFYSGSQGALLTRYDRRAGHLKDVDIWPDFFSGMPARDLTERWQWTFPIVFSPHDPGTIYASSQHLWKTTNEGHSWERISPDLTYADPTTLGDSGGPITKDQNGPEMYATIFTIAPSRLEKGTIWTGSDDGQVYITRNEGQEWTKITPPDLPKFSRISIIEASPHKAGTAYLAANRYQMDDRAPYLFRTDDYGATWTRIVNGIPTGHFPRIIREDPKRAGLLYVGTEHGVQVSFDNGANWQSLQLDLPDTPVHGIVVEESDLVIGTHGRSFYVLDGLAPIRQLSAEVSSKAVHLYKPETATRWSELDEDGGPSEGERNAARIDYYLAKAADKVTIDILDSQGLVIQTFSATAEENEKLDKNPPPGREITGRRPAPRVPTKAGLNRFLWNLRYPGAVEFPGMILWGAEPGRGPLAVPGSYQARVSASGQTMTQAFEVGKDPRLPDLSLADLKTQFDFAIRIRDRVSEANRAVIDIRSLKDQIKQRTDQAKDAKISAAGDQLAKQLSDLEEQLYQVRNRSGQDPLNFPIRLNNKLAALERIVETGDGKPTEQSYKVFAEQSASLDTILGNVKKVTADGTAELNKMLRGKRVPLLTAGAAPAAK